MKMCKDCYWHLSESVDTSLYRLESNYPHRIDKSSCTATVNVMWFCNNPKSEFHRQYVDHKHGCNEVVEDE